MSTLTVLNPLSQTPTSPIQQAVYTRFATRPRIDELIQTTLMAALLERYPTLTIDLSSTRLAIPHEGGGWSLPLFIDRVLAYLVEEAPFEISHLSPHNYHFLADHEGNRLKLAEGYEVDMRFIEALVKELPWRLPIEFKSALSQFWNESIEDGLSRWKWLANVLKDSLTMTIVQSSTLSDPVLESVRQVLDYPQSEERYELYGDHATRTYYIESTLTTAGVTERLIKPHLLLVRYPQGQMHLPLVMLCLPEGTIQTFSSIEAATQSRARSADSVYAVDTITTQCYEIEGDVFEAEAGLILSLHMSNISKLKLPCAVGLETLKATCSKITDSSALFLKAPFASSDTLSRLQLKLPDWMTKASRADQAQYRSWSLALARAKKVSQGLTYLSGIADIHSFTVTSLKQQIQRDQQRYEQPVPSAAASATFEPDDIELTFLLVAGTFLPGSTDATGVVERVKMTLTELALKNLCGKPRGELIKVEHRQGQSLPTWFSGRYITQSNGLIESVDIGKTYPEKLKAYLLDDLPSRTVREKRFSEQLKWQLPLQALELSLKGESGMSPVGVRYVAALLQTDHQERFTDGQQIVIRALALLSNSEAKSDVVSNMFIIEPLNTDAGPHVLYRPLYANSLIEFASRQDLINTIAQPGELQTSVLTWLTDAARTIYDNGGFKEPHYIRFIGEDSFPVTAFEKIEPVKLAVNGASDDLIQHLRNGQLLPYLYQVNALTLIHQADHNTVSNRESRWSIFLEGANLFFNIFVLPHLRGPVMLTAWFVLLVEALVRDIPALGSDVAVVRELAVVDLLQNLAMVLFQLNSSPPPLQTTRPAKGASQLRRNTMARRISKEWPAHPPAVVKEGVMVMAGEWQKKVSQDLDFSFANASNRLTPSLRQKLSQLAVPKPTPLPLPESSGARAGLYRVNESWYALLDDALYPVLIEAGEVSIEGGPHLQLDGHNHWSLDLRLRLSGGAPGKQIQALRERKARRVAELRDELMKSVLEHGDVIKKIKLEETIVKVFESDPRRTEDEVLNQRQKFLKEVMSDIERLESLIASNKERQALGVGLSNTVLIGYMDTIVIYLDLCMRQFDKMRPVVNAKWMNMDFTQGASSVTERDVYSAKVVQYRAFMKATIELNSQSIQWLEKINRYIDELAGLGSEGSEKSERLRQEHLGGQLTPLNIKQLQVLALESVSLNVFNEALEVALSELVMPLREQIQTHDQLNKLDFTTSERLDVLNSLVEQYGHVLDGLLSFRVVNAEEVDAQAFQALIDLLEGVYKEAEQQLANELEPLKASSKKIKRKRQPLSTLPHKRIFKTRTKGRLIGDLKPVQEGATQQTVEVRNDQNNEVLSTYIKEGENWNAVSVARPVVPTPPKRVLAEIKKEALKLYGMADVHLKRSEGLINSARFPQEAEEVLLHVADRLGQSASDLEEASKTYAEAWRQREDLELVGGMRARALEMRSSAQALRVRLSLKLPPTHGTLQYLLEKQLVSITLNRTRQKLKRDFIDEYAIRDGGGNLIWCAHFHYKEANTPKADYDVAHLKLWSQRTADYWSLKDKAKSQHEVVEVYRSQIGKNIAEQWFLPLTT